MSDRLLALLMATAVTAIVVGIPGLAYYIGNKTEQASCVRYAEQTGRETKHKWAWESACYVKVDGQWYLLDQVRSED